jgi:carboxylesterase type B
LLLLFGFTFAAGQGTPLTFTRSACSAPDVSTQAGTVCGRTAEVNHQPVYAYLGIPYAETTAGANRFEPPVPKAPWPGTLKATAFGPICPQNKPISSGPQSEDCLSVNVWSPARTALGKQIPSQDSSPLPVLVFIYGGAFVEGSSAVPLYAGSSQPLYDGAYLAKTQNLVVVTFNYRLGALGFLSGVAGRTGNYGLLDQQLALKWVHDNIRAFGGDPRQVALAGESAGAMSVGLHLLSVPSSAPLFAAAIMESNPFGLPYRTPKQAKGQGKLYLVAVGCDSSADKLSCLRKKPVSKLLAAQKKRLLGLTVLRQKLADFLSWGPVVDRDLVTSQPMAAALQEGLSKPTLMGTNANEGTIFVAGPEAKFLDPLAYRTLVRTLFGRDRYATISAKYPPGPKSNNTDQLIDICTDYIFNCSNRAVARGAKAPVYYYQFTHISSFNLHPDYPRCAGESCHGDELPFVFHTASGKMSFTPAEEQLSARMADYWGSFVHSHNPNAVDSASASWPEFNPQGQYLQLDVLPAVKAMDPKTCTFWDGLGYPLGYPVEEP